MKIKQISPVMPLIVVFLIGDAAFWWLGLCENNRAGIFSGDIYSYNDNTDGNINA